MDFSGKGELFGGGGQRGERAFGKREARGEGGPVERKVFREREGALRESSVRRGFGRKGCLRRARAFGKRGRSGKRRPRQRGAPLR